MAIVICAVILLLATPPVPVRLTTRGYIVCLCTGTAPHPLGCGLGGRVVSAGRVDPQQLDDQLSCVDVTPVLCLVVIGWNRLSRPPGRRKTGD